MRSHADSIERLRTLPDELEALVLPMNETELDTRLPDEWSVRQIVHHLADSHMSGNFRLRRPLTEPNGGAIMVYDQDALALQVDYAMPLGPSLMIVRGMHARWVVLLESLGEADWARTGVHPAWGEVSVTEIASRYADHCDNHLNQIKRTLGRL
jgi:hypothetical protein